MYSANIIIVGDATRHVVLRMLMLDLTTVNMHHSQ